MGRPKIKLYGVGVNDFDGPVYVGTKPIKEYNLWKSILQRCYSESYQKRKPTYKDCEVEPFLLSFTNFYHFIRGLKGFGEVDENGKPFQMDKDLLVKGNKTYGVDTICFVPQEINAFLVNRKNLRGEFLIGVCYNKVTGWFQCQLSINGKLKTLGYFSNEQDAFETYRIYKQHQAMELAKKWKEKIDHRVYDALMNFKVSIDD
ncbi:HNH homing endonuclease/ putative DNA-binding protein [Acinetobacter phage Bestia]|nr:HNH homing endonuclease/ putative DNA-binding protein [Acinetobacter phage Bestia]